MLLRVGDLALAQNHALHLLRDYFGYVAVAVDGVGAQARGLAAQVRRVAVLSMAIIA